MRFSRILALCLAAAAGCATPQLAPLPAPSPAWSEAEVAARTLFIEERLDASRRRAQVWHYGWLGAQTLGVGLGALGAVRATDAGSRAAGIATGGLAVGGYLYLVLLPMRARHGADALRAMPTATRAQKLARLARAHELLLYDARRASVQRSWLPHLVSLAVAGAAAGIVAGVGGRGRPAGFTGLAALAGGEAQLWSEPAEPRRALERYRSHFTRGRQVPVAGWSLATNPGYPGLALRFTW